MRQMTPTKYLGDDGALHDLPDKRYRTIVADPPWDIDWHSRAVLRDLQYPTMSLDEIRALPVAPLVDNRDEDAHLYLWTTSSLLFEAPSVAAAWGFKYMATLVWCKPPAGLGMGGTYVSNVEFILYCRKPGFVTADKREPRPDMAAVTARIAELIRAAGFTHDDIGHWTGTSSIAGWWTAKDPRRVAIPKPEHWETLKAHVPALAELDAKVAAFNAAKGTNRKPPAPLGNRIDTRWFTWPRGKHSEKPEAFLDMVETVSPGPYLELFARRNRLGWDTWGNEALEHVALETL